MDIGKHITVVEPKRERTPKAIPVPNWPVQKPIPLPLEWPVRAPIEQPQRQ